MAFDIIQQILQERLGELPAQDQPTLTATENTPNSEPDEEIVEQEDDAQPVFYKPDEVLRLEQWLHRTANAAVIMTVVYNLLQLPNTHEIVWSFFVNNDNALNFTFFAWLITVVMAVINAALGSVIFYFPLKALGSILKILMEMEFNSRGVK